MIGKLKRKAVIWFGAREMKKVKWFRTYPVLGAVALLAAAAILEALGLPAASIMVKGIADASGMVLEDPEASATFYKGFLGIVAAMGVIFKTGKELLALFAKLRERNGA